MPVDLAQLSSSLGFVDEMYDAYAASPDAVDVTWQHAFGGDSTPRVENGKPAQRGTASGTRPVRPTTIAPGGGDVASLVNAFRTYGHFAAQLDPLGLIEPVHFADLLPSAWGLGDTQTFINTGVAGCPSGTTVDVLTALERAYCGALGLEFMHIVSAEKRAWLAQQMELRSSRMVAPEIKRRVLQNLVNAEGFERFCHVKYPGTKRFSLEGGESLIPMLDLALHHANRLGAVEAVIGMAHRGRLTTLETILQRKARDIFSEFDDVEPEVALGGGDVKYHLGYSTDRNEPGLGPLHVSLAFNPSHLEAVDPVVLGRVRAKQLRHGDTLHQKVVGILVHGDAAFAGQGIVPEVLQLCGLPGYRTGGTVHIIVNNQVGFTASPSEGRSTPYCTDIAKMIECPIWHVNGDDPEAVASVIQMAMEYRAEFASDVIIDMYCYRKYGHNEMDDAGFTQPLMVARIAQMESVADKYGKRLIAQGVLTQEQFSAMAADRHRHLDRELESARTTKQRPRMPALSGIWKGLSGGLMAIPDRVDTSVSRETLSSIAENMARVPDGFVPLAKVSKLLAQRVEMGRGEKPLDWGMAELLAYGSILRDGYAVRLSGQDCGRGTFSHRHMTVVDSKTGAEHCVLANEQAAGVQARVYDSPLSEAGVLGFEYGFSLDYPDALVIWEAQFGDFANGAQVIIDQFLVASEDKWNRLSGLVLLLPHGYEGQGPEHSSARLERFLQACAEHNIQVAQPTTPAQMFHLLRRQMKRTWKKPLVVMTPKSLLRLPAAVSSIDDLTRGGFERIIGDVEAKPFDVKTVLLCSGKIYFELVEERKRRGDASVAIVRIEELYPWWGAEVQAAVNRFGNAKRLVWVQDEPANMGAASFVMPRLAEAFAGRAVELAARAESASPATGSHKAHQLEQQQIFATAFGR